MIILSFYNLLTKDNKNMLDSAAGGSFGRKSINDGFKLLNEMSLNQKKWASSEHETPAQAVGMYEVDPLNQLISNVEYLAMKVDNMHAKTFRVQFATSVIYELCGIVGHTKVDCHISIEQASYVINYG